MVDIITKRQGIRKSNVYRVKGWLVRRFKLGEGYNYKNFVLTVMNQLGISDRTAKEYINVALFQLKKTKGDLK